MAQKIKFDVVSEMLKVVSRAFIQLLQFNLMFFLKGQHHFHPFYPQKSQAVEIVPVSSRLSVQLTRHFLRLLHNQRQSAARLSQPRPPSTIFIKTSQHQSPSLVCRSYESCQPSPFYTQEQELWLFLFNAPPAGAAAQD